ncbi:hypothetical protein R5R35_009786 [Gryllus longicercus]|uniref:Uncharacterized protein n=1 Tax=Gryllus longicercus TaxID=2509291 RepID=A0AAN9Z7H0_9ORTH
MKRITRSLPARAIRCCHRAPKFVCECHTRSVLCGALAPATGGIRRTREYIRTSCFCPTHLCKSGSGCVLFMYFANRWQKLSHEQPAGVVDAHFFIEPIGRLDGVPTSDKTAARKGADAFGCWCANVE